jgi:hypothetical protein
MRFFQRMPVLLPRSQLIRALDQLLVFALIRFVEQALLAGRNQTLAGGNRRPRLGSDLGHDR